MRIFALPVLPALVATNALAGPVLHIPVAPFQESIECLATVESTSARLVRAPGFAGERVLIWLAEEGAEVDKGDVIARFDPTPVQQGLERTMLKSQEARDRMESLETDWTIRLDSERIRAAQLEATFGEAVRQVAASHFLPEIPKSIAAIKRDIASEQAEGAETKISLLEDSSQRQQDSAADWSQRIDQERDATSRDLDETVIHARESGFVTLLPVTLSGQPPRKVQTGDALERRQPFLKIQPSRASQLQLAVSARDLPLVKRGQPVDFVLQAEPERWLKAEISDIPGFALPSIKGKAPLFAVVASIPTQPGIERLRAAMTARARIHVSTTADTLAIPIDWVFHNNANRVVYENPDGHWQEIELPPGAIRAGDFLLLHPSFGLANSRGGLRIQPPPPNSPPARINGDISSPP